MALPICSLDRAPVPRFHQKKHLDDADDDEGDGRQALQGRGNNKVQTEGVPIGTLGYLGSS
jgi:hypothetical protein